MDDFLPNPQHAARIMARFNATQVKEQKVFVDDDDLEKASECSCTLCPSRERLDRHDYCCKSLFLYPLNKRGKMLKNGLESKLKERGSTPCITMDKLFSERLITEVSAEAAVALHAYHNGHEAKDANEALRYGCYRVTVATLLGPLGKGVRVRLPACVVDAVRTKWPSANGQYTGFKTSDLFEEE